MLSAFVTHIKLLLRRILPMLNRYPEFTSGLVRSIRYSSLRGTKQSLYSTSIQQKLFLLCAFVSLWFISFSQPNELNNCNVVWNSQSKNASESMPCGGGSIGANVWVENGELYLYLQQSGWFDENNQFLKAGRIKINLSPNPFAGKTFKQELILKDGYVNIKANNGSLSADINVWVDVFNPIVHIDVESNQNIAITASYETWRYKDRVLSTKENNANSWKWIKNTKVVTQKDSINFNSNKIVFFHQNNDSTIFDFAVKQQGLLAVKNQLYNPLQHLIFGGTMWGNNMIADKTVEGNYTGTDYKSWQLKSKTKTKKHSIKIAFNVNQYTSANEFKETVDELVAKDISILQFIKTKQWWNEYWQRSFIFIQPNNNDSNVIQASKNYNRFRYMLGCNAFGKYPTKFNGGLFTVDPVFTDTSIHGTPDYRSWGGGTFTAQNQRLVYWPMLKSGDVDVMKPQFDFYKNILANAELRSKIYWQHNGACFTEQMENFGLPNMAEYGYKRPENFDKGVEYNAWLEYEWDTALEFCKMILDAELYTDEKIRSYIPLIESCLIFFDEHYQYLAKQRGIKSLDANGHLVLYPSSGAETYKMAYNSTSTIAALQTVTSALLQSKYINDDKKKYFTELFKRIPPISFSSFNNKPTIAPAKSWERINNAEPTQLYPVFPWNMYGVGKGGLDTALNTYLYDTSAIKFRSEIGWKQDNIFAAKLGITKDAATFTVAKLKNSQRRFPAFWGPGFDWVPDMNQAGSGMIGLQEMLMQVDDKKIFLFPSWPKEWDVHFKLHAPYNTTVEVELKQGKIEKLIVLPKERETDIVIVN
jgi:hypothetical protein